jgi:hypothetical protein
MDVDALLLDQLNKADDHLGRSGAPTMHCARCDSFAGETADFCTECGAPLRLVGGDVDPIQVGTWTTAASAAAPGSEVLEDVTVPITVTAERPTDTGSEPDPGGQPEGPSPEPEQPSGLVTQMGEAEKAAWLDEVWGPLDDRGDSELAGH